MRWGAMAALLSALLAAPAAAERNPAVRVYVQAAGAGVHGVADSVEDVKKVLAEQKPNSLLTLAKAREQADLVLEVMARHTEKKMNYDLTPPVDWTFSIVVGALLDGDRSTPVKAETSAIIKSWTEAARILVGRTGGYAEENHHTLLRRRADWPAIGIEFEELTKERKKQFGVKDGKVVVTAVAPGSAGERAGLRAGDVIATLNGEKLKEPAKLARAIYARGPKTTLALGVVQGGANRAVSLAVPE
ncbi:MAG: PDZ domain-containing protein [Chloroflexi bacterium]|nr:MAG: PDZ domain-containing protein [Chloroflexota bacterium]